MICAKPPRTYSRLKQERISGDNEEEEIANSTTLDGFFLMKLCCVEDPSDLCSVNIAGLHISHAKPEDFVLFDNVAYINAADNSLNLGKKNQQFIVCLPIFTVIRAGHLKHKFSAQDISRTTFQVLGSCLSSQHRTLFLT